MNRYERDRALLALTGLGAAAGSVFASATDLGTGLERPLPLRRSGNNGGVLTELEQCPARTLSRIYWPLEARL